jgi:hypothetical protein
MNTLKRRGAREKWKYNEERELVQSPLYACMESGIITVKYPHMTNVC